MEQTYGQPGNVSTFNTINSTAHLYGGIFNLTGHGRLKAGNVIPGADARFARWLFPDWQVAPLVNGPAPLFIEPHQFVGTRMQTIEKVLAAGYGSAGAFTDILQSGLDVAPRPSTNYYQAVYSLSSSTPKVLGLTSFLLSWDTLLQNALPNNLQRVDCVLSTSTTTFTMAVEQGAITMMRKGDFHDPAMTVYGQAVTMDVRQNSPLSASDFTIMVYPSSAFHNEYVTLFPFQLGVGIAVAVFVFLSMMFAVAVLFRRIQTEKEEVLRTLLDAKKSYVRYISHELRTPLNAATLGLNMVVTQMKKKRNLTSDEAEMCETLSDIRLACSTAVDILNDLLSFEKLESGILVLHRENISVMKFMKEGIVMFSGQAKEQGVTLDLVPTIDEFTLKKFPRARPLRDNDEFSCDRFKMDQVLRNLVSNAIKFSPEGGKVTLRVFFDDTPPTVENVPKKVSKKRIAAGDLSSSLSGVSVRKSMHENSSINEVISEYEDCDSTPQDEQDYSGHGRVQIRNKMHDMDSFLVAAAINIVGEIRLGRLVIVVTDSGPGISEANQQKLFRGVIQFDPEKNQGGGGSGFGLFISKGIVDLHKGTIAVQSKGEGHGCSFILMMPMVRADVDPNPVVLPSSVSTTTMPVDDTVGGAPTATTASIPASAQSIKSDIGPPAEGHRRTSLKIAADWVDTMMPLHEGQNTSSSSSSSFINDNNELFRKKYRLLIVDDSHLSRKMLCKTMRVAGHECDEAGDGLIALTKVKDKISVGGGFNMYDAILMDTNMPTMDGPSAARAIRDLGVTVPIFGVTGNGEEKDIEHYKSQGATAVFVKPFDMNHFVRHMKEIDCSKPQYIALEKKNSFMYEI